MWATLLTACCLACWGTDVPQTPRYGAKGLHLNSNPLSDVPPGALATADNVVIHRDGIAESRRGYAASVDFGGSADRVGTLLTYADALYCVPRDEGSSIESYNGSTFTSLSLLGMAPATGYHLRAAEGQRRLYLATAGGVYRVQSGGGTTTLAGAPSALDGTAALTGASGFLPINSQVAYRYHWTRKDANGVPMRGAVSGRVVAVNPSAAATAVNVTLSVPIPSDVLAGDYLEVYRSATTAAADTPAGDDMAKVYEAIPSTADLAAFTVSIPDVVPEGLRLGETLHTSPNSGDGILADKDRPPLVRDVALYAGRVWGAYLTERRRFQLRLLSNSPTGNAFLADGAGTEITLASSSPPAGLSVSQQVEYRARSMAYTLNAIPSAAYTAKYLAGEDDIPGLIGLEGKAPNTASWYLFTNAATDDFSPRLPVRTGIATGALVRVGSTVTATTGAAHGFAVGDSAVLVAVGAADANFPVGTKVVATVPTTTSFTYTEAGSAVASASGYRVQPTDFATRAAIPAQVAKNGLAFSNADETDAWPLVHRLYVGSANADIQRAVALGDALYVFKTDGLWRVTGTGPEDFSTKLFDATVLLAAPSSVVSVGGRLFALTSQGVVAISETGAEVVSRPIETALLPLLTNAASAVSNYAFGVSVEADREYRLYLPTTSADTYATQCYRYNLLTRTWTRSTEDATHGLVFNGKVHLGHPTDNALRAERRTHTAADYQDESAAAIDVTQRWQVDVAGHPGGLKRWQSVAVTFEAPAPQDVTLSFSTEVDTVEATQTVRPVGNVAFAYVPVQHSRSAQLTVGVAHSVAGEKCAVLGVSAQYTPSSERLGR